MIYTVSVLASHHQHFKQHYYYGIAVRKQDKKGRKKRTEFITVHSYTGRRGSFRSIFYPFLEGIEFARSRNYSKVVIAGIDKFAMDRLSISLLNWRQGDKVKPIDKIHKKIINSFGDFDHIAFGLLDKGGQTQLRRKIRSAIESMHQEQVVITEKIKYEDTSSWELEWGEEHMTLDYFPFHDEIYDPDEEEEKELTSNLEVEFDDEIPF